VRPIALKRGYRTPFVKQGKEFSRLNAVDLSALLIDALLERGSIPQEHIQHVVWGMVVPDPNIYSIGREAVLASRLDNRVEAYSLSRACATSLQAAANAASFYHAFPEESSVTLAGGVESFSATRPVLTDEASRFFKTWVSRASFGKKISQFFKTPIPKFFPVPPSAKEYSTGFTMGEHCEMMVKEFHVTRERQDALALASHQNAHRVRHLLADHLIELEGVHEDTLIRKDTSLKALADLPPVFDRKEGTLTAGNSSPYTDGAAAVYVISPALEKEIPPDAYLVDYEFVAVHPQEGLLMGPGKALLKLLSRNRLRWDDFSYLEIHEAFSGEVLCNVDALNDATYRSDRYGIDYDPGLLDEKRLNPWGSSIAYGHPFGATGARMLNQAITFLKTENREQALLGICTAGGLAGGCILRIAR